MQAASFRGVPFRVKGESAPVGRDVVVHEYPKKDEPFAEDMGRRTRPYRFSAYVVGPKCFEERDALIEALDKPGPGELVHPWYGRKTVTATSDCTVSHDMEEGGVVRFELVFVDSGKLENPKPVPNTSQQLKAAAESVEVSALDRFQQALSVVDMARVKANSLASGVSGIFGAVQGYLSPFTSLIGTVSGLLDTVMNAPANLSGMLLGALGEITRGFSSFGGSVSDVRSSASAVPVLAALPTPTGSDAAALQTAVVHLFQDVAIANALRDAAEMPVSLTPTPYQQAVDAPSLDVQVSASVVIDETPVADDVIAAGDVVSEAIWQVALESEPQHFAVLTDARQALEAHLSGVARAGVRLTTYSPSDTVPALVLAYSKYGDARRADEIVARNRLVYPGFVPAVPLQIARE
ncbi:DNA circulation family protein [Pandoraea apista]|uniref:DNA circulation family protein n=1 Tax=Pandoraea apista TaxID=93218 RepID=A0A5E5P3D6_9BURK|nr:DNA circularization N-terminal domain-containing protein [Pandoraea apista]VVG70947.1 DNA circulation family protein [Pandoraea apista]